MDATSPTAASLAQYLEAHGYKEAAHALRREAKVAKPDALAAAASQDNGAVCTSPLPPAPASLPRFCSVFLHCYLYSSIYHLLIAQAHVKSPFFPQFPGSTGACISFPFLAWPC